MGVHHLSLSHVSYKMVSKSKAKAYLDHRPWTLLSLKFVNRNRYRKVKPQTIFSMSECSFATFWPKWLDHSLWGITPINDSDYYIYCYNLLTVQCRNLYIFGIRRQRTINWNLHTTGNYIFSNKVKCQRTKSWTKSCLLKQIST